MTNAPLKRDPCIRELSKDHHHGLLFCWKIKYGLTHKISKKRICTYISFFWENHLKEHFRNEEDILLDKISEAEITATIKQQHGQIEMLIKESANDENNNKLTELVDLLITHIRFEERTLFPYIEQFLNKDILSLIGKELSTRHLPYKEQYTDSYWAKVINNN